MSDETVLQRAMEDLDGTSARIEELRAQIAQHEEHIGEIDRFIATYRRYASDDQGAASTPSPAFAYADYSAARSRFSKGPRCQRGPFIFAAYTKVALAAFGAL